MKKLFATAFIAALTLASCSKKENTYQQDSNTMLSEPEGTVTDSAVPAKPVDQATVAVPQNNTAASAANVAAAEAAAEHSSTSAGSADAAKDAATRTKTGASATTASGATTTPAATK